MVRHFTLEYWLDEDWYVGRLKEIPGIFSQATTFEGLVENIQECYHLMMMDSDLVVTGEIQTKEIEIEV